MDIQTKDGILLRGIPDGTHDDVIKERIRKIRAERTSSASLVDQIPGGVEKYTQPLPPDKPKTIPQRLRDFAAGSTSTAAGILDLPSRITGFPWLKSEIGRLQEGVDKGSMEYLGGQIADPAALAIGSGTMKAAQSIPVNKIVQAMLGGAGAGGAVSGLQGQDIATNAGVGAVVPVALGGVGAVGKKIWNIADQVVSPGGANRAAGRVAIDVAGDRTNDVIHNLGRASSSETAQQAATRSGSREVTGLMRMAQENAPTTTGGFLDKQVARRVKAMDAVKPDLAKSLAERDFEKTINYGLAFNQQINADPKLAVLARDPYFRQAMSEVSRLAESKGISPKTDLTEYLHLVKTRMDEMVGKTGDTALERSEKNAVQNVREQLIDWIGKKNPAYDFARTEHRRLSQPVDQAKVIQDIQDTIKGVAGAERATPMFNALERGESRLVKGATGFASGDLSTVLTPRQMKVVNAVQSQIEGGKLTDRYASAGAAKARNVFNQDEIPITIPNMLSRPVMLANAVIKRTEGHGKQATLDALSRLNLAPREMAEVMRTASEDQRRWMLDAIAKRAAPYTIGAQASVQRSNDK